MKKMFWSYKKTTYHCFWYLN